jgi:hypothetical protein
MDLFVSQFVALARAAHQGPSQEPYLPPRRSLRGQPAQGNAAATEPHAPPDFQPASASFDRDGGDHSPRGAADPTPSAAPLCRATRASACLEQALASTATHPSMPPLPPPSLPLERATKGSSLSGQQGRTTAAKQQASLRGPAQLARSYNTRWSGRQPEEQAAASLGQEGGVSRKRKRGEGADAGGQDVQDDATMAPSGNKRKRQLMQASSTRLSAPSRPARVAPVEGSGGRGSGRASISRAQDVDVPLRSLPPGCSQAGCGGADERGRWDGQWGG